MLNDASLEIGKERLDSREVIDPHGTGDARNGCSSDNGHKNRRTGSYRRERCIVAVKSRAGSAIGVAGRSGTQWSWQALASREWR